MYSCTRAHNRTGWDGNKGTERIARKKEGWVIYSIPLERGGHIHLNMYSREKRDMRCVVHVYKVVFLCFYYIGIFFLKFRLDWAAAAALFDCTIDILTFIVIEWQTGLGGVISVWCKTRVIYSIYATFILLFWFLYTTRWVRSRHAMEVNDG